jgi:hypothetical protein
MRTESARGNVRGNKRPDFELHPREQDYEAGRSTEEAYWRFASAASATNLNQRAPGSSPGAPSPKEQAQPSQEIPFGKSMTVKPGYTATASSSYSLATATSARASAAIGNASRAFQPLRTQTRSEPP